MFEFHFGRSSSQSPARPRPEEPFRILVLTDLGGRADPSTEAAADPLAGRRIRSVDVDNVETVMAKAAPRLRLPVGSESDPAIELTIDGPDGFHPDRIYDGLDLFQVLARTRQRLLDPATFAETARELGLSAPPAASGGKTAPRETDTDTLERLLGKPLSGATSRVDISGFLRRIVEPHVIPEAAPGQQEMVRSIDEACTGLMRRILHHPSFQSLEARWRGLLWLISRIETGEDLQIHLLDASRQELVADLDAAGADLSATALYRLVVDAQVALPGGRPWSLILGDLTFGSDPSDLRLLGALGAIASRAGGPFLAAADPRLLGCESVDSLEQPGSWTAPAPRLGETWQALRGSAVASWIGLALPRMLLRLPYGSHADEIDRFEFEEMPASGGRHEDHLWGNPAYACGLLIASAFTRGGWSMQPGDLLDVDDLPAVTFLSDGEKRLKPPAEILLGERAGEAVLGAGLMPLMSYRDRHAARVVRFQSIARPLAPLSGPWA